MKFKNIINILKNFRKKYRLNFRDQHTEEEVWHLYISAFNVVASLVAFTLILFIIIASTIAYTPILDLLPGYPGNKSRELLIKNVIRLDSLQQEMIKWEQYRENISLIMEGKTPVSMSASTNDSISRGDKNIISPSALDSVLRAQMENTGDYKLQKAAKTRKTTENTFELFAPTKGIVTRSFDPQLDIYGIDITVSGSQSVLAVLDGTVVLSTWTPKDGYIVQIQYAGNMLSTYKNLSQVIQKESDRVKAGEVIGYVGSKAADADKSEAKVAKNETSTKAHLYFELWHNGSAVDPQNYIVF